MVKTARVSSQNVRLDLIKKMSTHTWWFRSQTTELYAFLRDEICVSGPANVMERLLTVTDRTRIDFAHVIDFSTITLGQK